ncbi:hypothetical protein EMIHUDRAFT_213864 [Emiliania huxleyi CCMP1516]|uniref:Uncharacterized protein n=2 Tax=Emiliania huxleyi TaxID=2903 RepID=A0A0D3ILG1_EMIH1|nr:hypothetical protein EMIHUDRAFT_213864 [Emiliania huxleyi CCMP1516]EOD12096.1 hypothetical protein EMIHUDRAFT_213864 [Emiliania huxleyi CCMP1516]|eukprot:XP_005764525.1 hypothetical protein EMIHUDRAFT_213864 [Emiliania huxleyi CCMP1516]
MVARRVVERASRGSRSQGRPPPPGSGGLLLKALEPRCNRLVPLLVVLPVASAEEAEPACRHPGQQCEAGKYAGNGRFRIALEAPAKFLELSAEAVRRVCGALGMREQFEAAMAAGELLEMLESLPRGAVEASVRLMRGYNRTGEWPEPILTSPAPQRGRSPSPVDEWSDG